MGRRPALLFAIGEDGAYAAWRSPYGIDVYRIEFLGASFDSRCLVRLTSLEGTAVARLLVRHVNAAVLVVEALKPSATRGDGPPCPFEIRRLSSGDPPLAVALRRPGGDPRRPEPIRVWR